MTAPTAEPVSAPATVVDQLVEHLRSKDLALDGQERPAAILWTDPRGDWKPLIEAMQTRVEELLVLGDYAPEHRRGPAIWIRCLVDGAIDKPSLPADRPPIVYLPGVARQDLRAGEECADELKPLVELMFRGALWLQQNGSDWAVSTFLTSTSALGLDIARDERTLEAMLRALPEIAVTPMTQLAGRRLEADDFDRMLSDDVVRDLLRWMGDPEGTQARLGEGGWGAFCNQSREELGFDPETDSDVTAGELLGLREGQWARVWERFEEAPAGYPGIEDLLRRCRPGGSLPFDREAWPDLNEEDEAAVRKGLKEMASRSHTEACDAIANLEKSHGARRGWVWARLGRSPMAQALQPLTTLAAAVRSAVGGNTPDEIAACYVERGWQADAAAWEVVAEAPASEEALLSTVVKHLLEPWLDDSARAFQEAAERSFIPGRGEQPVVEAGDDGCVLFSDGLRYDLGRRLAERLEGRGCRVTVDHRWAAAPTVTATSKPAVSPAAEGIVGHALEKDFAAVIEASGKPANAPNLRKAIEASGYQVFAAGTMDMPMEHPARGWLERGDIDSMGHKLKGRLARQIDEELQRLTDTVVALLGSGWVSVRVVTDHGWLLLPGGLPKVDLPKHLTESRWSRCAVIAGESAPEVPRFPWHWNAAESFATAPGIACFNKSEEYAHGGLSIQECLTPDIFVELGGEVSARATIDSITWRGLRCFVEAATGSGGATADLRLERPEGESVVSAPKPVTDGAVSLVLKGDEHEDAQLVLVLIDADDKVLAHRPTTVGEDV